MPVQTLVSVDEYLHSSYEYDKEYVEGELIERKMPTYKHGRLQALLCIFFGTKDQEWGVEVVSDTRVRVRPKAYRVPDVCIVSVDAPEEDVIQTPPLCIVEILSPDDTVAELREKAREYLQMGVTHVWSVDPVSCECYRHQKDGMETVRDGVFRVAGTPIEIPIREILDSMQRR
jgi:Uma2 family endonuclease